MLEPSAGTDLNTYIRQMKKAARKSKKSVRGTFNGTAVIVHPTSHVVDIVRIYRLQRQLRELAEIASQKKLDC